MKQFITLMILLALGSSIMAQAPQSINYQGVARNSGGIAYASQPINVRLSVRDGSANGGIQYSETRSITTNQFGLFNVQIGSPGASNVQGSFAAINWAGGTKFLQTELSLNGQPFTDLGTTQMMSVPYAISSLQSKQLVLPYDTAFSSPGDYVLRINNSSTSALAAIMGESDKGEGIRGRSSASEGVTGSSSGAFKAGIYGQSSASNGYGVRGLIASANTTGAGINGIAENGTGVLGETVNGKAVVGRVASTGTGTGVTGESTLGNGVYGSSVSGNGVFGVSTSATGVAGKFFNWNSGGKALDVTGNVKISGGNTNPGAGKVLTSDAGGNATWQSPQYPSTPATGFIGFGVPQNGLQNLPSNVWFKVHPATEEYDGTNNFNLQMQTPSSTFTAPVSGLYRFNIEVRVESDDISNDIEYCYLRLMLRTSGINYEKGFAGEYNPGHSVSKLEIERTLYLNAGDQVWSEVLGETEDLTNPILDYCEFTGFRIR